MISLQNQRDAEEKINSYDKDNTESYSEFNNVDTNDGLVSIETNQCFDDNTSSSSEDCQLSRFIEQIFSSKKVIYIFYSILFIFINIIFIQ